MSYRTLNLSRTVFFPLNRIYLIIFYIWVCVYVYVYMYMCVCIYIHTHTYLGEGNDSPLQYSCLENPMDRSLVDYSPWGCTELDTTECACTRIYFYRRTKL